MGAQGQQWLCLVWQLEKGMFGFLSKPRAAEQDDQLSDFDWGTIVVFMLLTQVATLAEILPKVRRMDDETFQAAQALAESFNARFNPLDDEDREKVIQQIVAGIDFMTAVDKVCPVN